MWTSNTLMKMETRMTGSGSSPPSPLVSSWGGVPSWIIVTSPSAGEAITPPPEGVALIGSRKNAATPRVMPANGQGTRFHPNKAGAEQEPAATHPHLHPPGETEAKQQN